MISTGAICISKFLQKSSLKVLDISENNIGDNGINAIAEVLACTQLQIRKLCVRNCGITLTGVRSLGAGLLVNKSVRTLWLEKNDITVEGAHMILQSVIENGVCQEVTINDEYNTDDKVKEMQSILQLKNIQLNH